MVKLFLSIIDNSQKLSQDATLKIARESSTVILDKNVEDETSILHPCNVLVACLNN